MNSIRTPTPMYRPEDVARLYAVSVGTLANWRSAGIGPTYVKVGGKCVRYRADDLAAWDAANTVEPVSA